MPNQLVFRLSVLPESLLASGDPEIFSLRHPGSGRAASFLLEAKSEGTRSLLREVLPYAEDHRCWFMGDSTVESHGRLYIVAACDPAYIALPYLRFGFEGSSLSVITSHTLELLDWKGFAAFGLQCPAMLP